MQHSTMLHTIIAGGLWLIVNTIATPLAVISGISSSVDLSSRAPAPTSPSTDVAMPRRGSISITPHSYYSSSIGVLGCKININRVAYWPYLPECNRYCVNVTANGRTVTLLHIDMSGGAHDISYDAWNMLNVGQSAAENPSNGGGIPAEYDWVANEECNDLIASDSNKLPLSAANSMNWAVTCKDGVEMWNIVDPQCTLGVNELCQPPDWSKDENQPHCSNQLGIQSPLDLEISNIEYLTS